MNRTENDLRAVYAARTADPDADAVLAGLYEQLAAPHRSAARRLAPEGAAAAVFAIGVGTAVVATGHGGHSAPAPGHGTRAAANTVVARPSSTATVGTVPAGTLHWGFTVARLAGYTVSYDGYQADQQSAIVTSTRNPGVQAGITVYAHGAFDPATGGVDATAVSGAPVTVHGHHGIFVAGPADPTLFWTYAPNSWASVDVGNGSAGDSRSLALQLADAVRVGPSAPITLPFSVGALPKPLTLLELEPGNDLAAAFYGTPGGNQDIVVSVSRVAAPTTPVLKRANEAVGAGGGRTISRTLPDGSSLHITVEPDHVGEISRSQQQTIADSIDVTPTLADPTTWLSVPPTH